MRLCGSGAFVGGDAVGGEGGAKGLDALEGEADGVVECAEESPLFLGLGGEGEEVAEGGVGVGDEVEVGALEVGEFVVVAEFADEARVFFGEGGEDDDEGGLEGLGDGLNGLVFDDEEVVDGVLGLG